MSYHGYISITGARQGLISAGCSTEESMGNRCQSDHLDEIMVLAFSHNLSNPGNTQRITHRPILITKHIDKATPLLAAALNSRELLKCEINFYRINRTGRHERYFSMRLAGGLIVDQRLEMPHSIYMNGQDAQEYLAIRYSDIDWHHHISGTSGYASWGDYE
ncbi:Hcp family type VI secretion system effector [Pseudomonas entomophila]|uniref:Hcp family type VI secretion system effector n=1 Tax=Pseudomonas entomophila TaxID=312306 RepID=UPI0023D7FF90|nr:Hcp family type VI secretion system effector [Pseudomonas entomophila]MDF0733080.1 Hcp family type VI secretion system effector [Pseudomonas entomophila]